VADGVSQRQAVWRKERCGTICATNCATIRGKIPQKTAEEFRTPRLGILPELALDNRQSSALVDEHGIDWPCISAKFPGIRTRLLGDVDGDAPGLVAGEELGRRGSFDAPIATSSLDHLVRKLLELRWHISRRLLIGRQLMPVTKNLVVFGNGGEFYLWDDVYNFIAGRLELAKQLRQRFGGVAVEIMHEDHALTVFL
jgi:hypothetical protein